MKDFVVISEATETVPVVHGLMSISTLSLYSFMSHFVLPDATWL